MLSADEDSLETLRAEFSADVLIRDIFRREDGVSQPA